MVEDRFCDCRFVKRVMLAFLVILITADGRDVAEAMLEELLTPFE